MWDVPLFPERASTLAGKVDFVFFSAQIRLLFLILLCLGVGFGAGWVFEKMRARRKRSASGT